MNMLQRIVLVNYYQRKESRFIKNAKKIESEIKKIKNLEATAKYVVKFYIVMGNFYFENGLNLIHLKVSNSAIVDRLKNAFDYYVMAYDHSKKDASKRLHLLILEIYNRRLSSLSNLEIDFKDEIINGLKF